MMSLFTLRKKIGGRVCVLQIFLCQGQHRTMQQAHVLGCLELGKL